METYKIRIIWPEGLFADFKRGCVNSIQADYWFRKVVRARSRHPKTGDHCVKAIMQNESQTFTTEATYNAYTIKTTKVESNPSFWPKEEEHKDGSGAIT